MPEKITPHTLIPLVWIKTLIVACLSIVAFAIGGVWWAATVQSDVNHLREDVTALRAFNEQRFNRIEQKLDAKVSAKTIDDYIKF